MTASFDRVLIDPDADSLATSLREAVAAVDREMRTSSQMLPFHRDDPHELDQQMRATGEGAREWCIPGPGPNGVRAALVAVWWADFLGRHHLRLLGGCRHRGMELPTPLPSPHRPALSCVYPAISVIATEHRRSRLLVVCECGAWGPPRSLGWMGTQCGPCHDRDEPPRRVVLPSAASVACLAFAPDGTRLASWDDDGVVNLWDVDEPDRPLRSWYSTSFPGKVAFNGDGTALACLARSRRLWVYDVEGEGVKGGAAQCFTFGREPSQLFLQKALRGEILGSALGSFDDPEATSLPAGEPVVRMPYPIECQTLALSPTGHLLAAASNQGICIWDMTSGEGRARVDEPDCGGALAWSPDGTLIACGVRAPFWKAILWDYARQERRAVLGGAEWMTALDFTPDGQYLITAEQSTLRTWQTRDGQERRSLTLVSGERVGPMAIARDGRTVALGTATGVRLWPLEMLLPEG